MKGKCPNIKECRHCVNKEYYDSHCRNIFNLKEPWRKCIHRI